MKANVQFCAVLGVAFFHLISLRAYGQSTDDDVIFIHHSTGQNWLEAGLKSTLSDQPFIDEVNDISYDTDMQPDPGRPDSLGPVPGDNTNMNHWILWFNDYLEGVKKRGCADGRNVIIMFKSCYPTSNIASDGTEPGDPFSSLRTMANYKSVYRIYEDPNGTYVMSGYQYKPLKQIFAENQDTLFIAVTAPPRHYAPTDATNDQEAQRARDFNNWLKNEWLTSYLESNSANVAVFDWFDVLAYPSDDPSHPNRLRSEYGGERGDSHPNTLANQNSAQLFDEFIQQAYNDFIQGGGASFLWGDLNKDGITASLDAGFLLQYDALLLDRFPGYPEVRRPDFPPAADLNADGVAGALDAGFVLQYDAFLISWFPCDLDQDGFGPDSGQTGKMSARKPSVGLHDTLTDAVSPGRKLSVSVTCAISQGTFNPLWILRFSIDDANNIQSIRLALHYNHEELFPDETSLRWLFSGVRGEMATNNRQKGALVVSGALNRPLAAGPSDLISVTFESYKPLAANDVPSPIVLDETLTRINDGAIRIHPDSVSEIHLRVGTGVTEWAVF